MTTTTSIFESKFGFHPCNRQTYKKLKRIRHMIEKCRGANNRFYWWHRKAPQNRVQRVKIPNGTRFPTVERRPVPEPKIFERFWEKRQQPKSWGLSPEQCRVGLYETQSYRDFMIDYEQARHPAKSAEDVRPLLHSEEQLDAIIAEMETYFAK